jgi:hypothetical protein
MKRITWLAVVGLVLAMVTAAAATAGPPTEEFEDAELRVEINATDGDAGLQIELDHEPWREVALRTPDGRVALQLRNQGVLRDFGLTEFFAESNEPPFSELPLAEFKQMFPEGEYLFEGTAVDGTKLVGSFELSHDFPAGPEIISPEEDETVAPGDLVVEWTAGDQPAGVEIVAYELIVDFEGEESRSLSMELPASVTEVAIPSEFLVDEGEHKVEVLAIEENGNQTATEVTFSVEE